MKVKDERMTYLSSLVVRFGWRWLRKEGYDIKTRKIVLFQH